MLTPPQMLRMAFEREVVLNIRHRLETQEQRWLFDENAHESDVPSEAEFNHSHVHLGSRQRAVELHTYEKFLDKTLGFSDFGDSLAKFLREYARVDVHGSDFEGDGFEGHQYCIFNYKVVFVSSLFVLMIRVLIHNRSSLTSRAKSRLIVKRPRFKRRKSFTSRHRGAIQGRDTIQPSSEVQHEQVSCSSKSAPCSAYV
jgi:hypothetical protein